MEKRYVCNRWPFLKINIGDGKQLAFEAGLFISEDETTQAKIESHPDYGVHIHPQDFVAAALQTAAPEGKGGKTGGGSSLLLPGDEDGTGDKIEYEEIKLQAGKEKLAALVAEYGEPTNKAGNWYTFRRIKEAP